MRPVAFGEAFPAGSTDPFFKRQARAFFIVIKFWMDNTSGVALDLKTGVPCYQVEDEEGRVHLLFISQSRKMEMTTAGVSGGPITPASIRGRSLRVPW